MFKHRYRAAALASIALGAAALLPISTLAVTLSVSVSDPTPTSGSVITVQVATVGEALPPNVNSAKIALQFNSPDVILTRQLVGVHDPNCSGAGISYPLDTIFLITDTAPGVFPQVVTFTATSGSGLSGVGCVVVFQFLVSGTVGQTDFTFTPATEFRAGGTPLPLVLPPFPPQVVLPNVTGTVRTFAGNPVPEVVASLLPGPFDTDISGRVAGLFPNPVGGDYALAGRIGSSYTLEFRRTTDRPLDFASGAPATDLDAIGAEDVQLIITHWNNPALEPLDNSALDADHCPSLVYPQRIAANVNYYCNAPGCDPNEITGQDASILIRVIHYENGVLANFPGYPDGYPIDPSGATPSANWRFFCGSRSTGALTTSGVAYDPIAVLVGDVSGNYVNSGFRPRKGMSSTVLTVGNVASTAPRVTIPVDLHGANHLLGLDAAITFDENVLRFVEATPAENGETQVWGLSRGGTVSLVVIGNQGSINNDGTIANLVFDRVNPAAARAETPIMVLRARSNGEYLMTENGSFTASPTGVSKLGWGAVKGLYR